MEISNGELLKRDIWSENHSWASQNEATNIRWALSWQTLSRTPVSRAIGGETYTLAMTLKAQKLTMFDDEGCLGFL